MVNLIFQKIDLRLKWDSFNYYENVGVNVWMHMSPWGCPVVSSVISWPKAAKLNLPTNTHRYSLCVDRRVYRSQYMLGSVDTHFEYKIVILGGVGRKFYLYTNFDTIGQLILFTPCIPPFTPCYLSIFKIAPIFKPCQIILEKNNHVHNLQRSEVYIKTSLGPSDIRAIS